MPHYDWTVRVLIDLGIAGMRRNRLTFSKTHISESIMASIGTAEDVYDSALTQATMWLFNTQALGVGPAFRTGPRRARPRDVVYPSWNGSTDATVAACADYSAASRPCRLGTIANFVAQEAASRPRTFRLRPS